MSASRRQVSRRLASVTFLLVVLHADAVFALFIFLCRRRNAWRGFGGIVSCWMSILAFSIFGILYRHQKDRRRYSRRRLAVLVLFVVSMLVFTLFGIVLWLGAKGVTALGVELPASYLVAWGDVASGFVRLGEVRKSSVSFISIG
jgi:hypothetical protein